MLHVITAKLPPGDPVISRRILSCVRTLHRASYAPGGKHRAFFFVGLFVVVVFALSTREFRTLSEATVQVCLNTAQRQHNVHVVRRGCGCGCWIDETAVTARLPFEAAIVCIAYHSIPYHAAPNEHKLLEHTRVGVGAAW